MIALIRLTRWIPGILLAALVLVLPADAAEWETRWDPFADIAITRGEGAALSAAGSGMTDEEYRLAFEDMEKQYLEGLKAGKNQIEIINRIPNLDLKDGDFVMSVVVNTIYDYPEETAHVHTGIMSGGRYEHDEQGLCQKDQRIWVLPMYVEPILTEVPDPEQPGGTVTAVDQDLLLEYQITFRTALDAACSVCFTPEMTPLEKVVVAHDYLTSTAQYDPYVQLNHSTPEEGQMWGDVLETAGGYRYEPNWSVYTPFSCLVERNTVCQGYSLALKAMLDREQIPCAIVSSDVMGHAWNMVQLGENWYHIDITWDEPFTEGQAVSEDWAGRVDRMYFLKSDAAMGKDHEGWETKDGLTCPVDWEFSDKALASGYIPVFQRGDSLYTVLPGPDSSMALSRYQKGTDFAVGGRLAVRECPEVESAVLDPETGVLHLLHNQYYPGNGFYEGDLLSMDLDELEQGAVFTHQYFQEPYDEGPDGPGHKCGLVLGVTGELTLLFPEDAKVLSLWRDYSAQDMVLPDSAPIHSSGDLRVSCTVQNPTVETAQGAVLLLTNSAPPEQGLTDVYAAVYSKGRMLMGVPAAELLARDSGYFTIGELPPEADTIKLFATTADGRMPLMQELAITQAG